MQCVAGSLTTKSHTNLFLSRIWKIEVRNIYPLKILGYTVSQPNYYLEQLLSLVVVCYSFDLFSLINMHTL